MLVVEKICAGSTEAGLYEWSTTPVEQQRLVAADRTTASPLLIGSETPAWLKDGSGALVVAEFEYKAGGQSGRRAGLAVWDRVSGQMNVILRPTNDVSDVLWVTVVGDGRAVVGMAIGEPPRADLFAIDPATGTLDQLTTSGNNVQPRW